MRFFIDASPKYRRVAPTNSRIPATFLPRMPVGRRP
jgi:hypothetical protein